MNKLLATSLILVALAATTRQEASAWTKFNFSAGFNFSYEGGNNRFFWGLINSGQVPGYPSDLSGGYQFGPAPCYGSYGYPVASYGYPTGGSYVADAAPQAPAARPTQLPRSSDQTTWYGNQAYQPAFYQHPAPAAYYPQATPYYQQAPSYWYGY